MAILGNPSCRFLRALALYAVFTVAASPSLADSPMAEYEIVFEGLWDEKHITLAFPTSAHFTNLVGATHVEGEPLWQPGALASLGIENVAELGAAGELLAEVSAGQTDGTADLSIDIAGFFGFPNQSSTVILVDAAFPQLSLASMVAPSPDWFVGVSGLSLRDAGQWIPSIVIDLVPYDAGTEEGMLFGLSNPSTVPQQPIARAGLPFLSEPVIGRLHVTRLPEPAGGAAAFAIGIPLAGLSLLRRERRQRSHARASARLLPASAHSPRCPR